MLTIWLGLQVLDQKQQLQIWLQPWQQQVTWLQLLMLTSWPPTSQPYPLAMLQFMFHRPRKMMFITLPNPHLLKLICPEMCPRELLNCIFMFDI